MIVDPLPQASSRKQADDRRVDRDTLGTALRELVRATARLAAFCEHVEHNERSSIDDATAAGATLRDVAQDLARASGISLARAYEARIRGVEAASLLSEFPLEGANRLAEARTWRAVQAAQIVHDRLYHPDVFGLSKLDQIRHYTFHVMKLTGLLADAIDSGSWAEFESGRLSDIAIFGVKIATVCNERLEDSPIP